jgi:hypothetical protein
MGADANAAGLLGVNGCGSLGAEAGNANRIDLPSSGTATVGSFDATTEEFADRLTGGAAVAAG